MKYTRSKLSNYCLVAVALAILLFVSPVVAQQPSAVVPTLVNFSGMVTDINGKPLSGVHGVTFYLYKDSQGGAPLWMETQNVQADSHGHYTVMLGSTTNEGLPKDLFVSGEARWLAVQAEGQAEQPRVLLLSVPYALKAADAQTLGGLPASAFALAVPSSSPSSTATMTSAPAEADALPPAGSVTGSGTLDFIPLWTSTSAIGNSVLFQSGSGSTAKIGINTTAPGATLDVKGTTNVEGLLTLPAQGTATASGGKASQPHDWVASSFNSSTSAAVNQTFQWKAEASGNNTATPSGTLNLLFGSGTASPAETGLKLSSKGLFTFATGQTFPGAGTITGVTTASGSGLTGGGTAGSLSLSLLKTCTTNQTLQWNGTSWACATAGGTGTVTSVGLAAPTADFTVSGSPITGAGTLNFAWNVAPTNANAANAIVKRDSTGSFNATSITGTGTFSATTANVNAIVGSTSLDGGSAIVGSTTATAGNNRTYGVTGNSVSSVAGSTGVLGLDGNTNVLGTGGFTMGLQGVSSNTANGLGVFGLDGTNLSGMFAYLQSAFYSGVGVWGDGGPGPAPPLFSYGVVGTVDDGTAGLFLNNSSSSDALAAFTFGDGNAFYAGNPAGAGCTVDNAGNLNCSGSKNAVVPIDGGKRIVAMSAIEAPQNWFEDAGEAALVNGAAAIQLDSTYTQTVNTDTKYQVFLTPYGDCQGLYVSNRTANSFEVHELGGGTASLNFGYRIMALRKNYENIRFADHTHYLDGLKKMRERMKAGTAHPYPHDPVNKAGLAPSLSPATAQLVAPGGDSAQ